MLYSISVIVILAIGSHLRWPESNDEFEYSSSVIGEIQVEHEDIGWVRGEDPAFQVRGGLSFSE